MQLHLNDDQKVLQDSFARVFRQESTPARIRAAEPLGFDGAPVAGAGSRRPPAHARA